MNKINKAIFVFKSEKRSDEGHLKQTREGLRNNFLFLFGLIQKSNQRNTTNIVAFFMLYYSLLTHCILMDSSF